MPATYVLKNVIILLECTLINPEIRWCNQMLSDSQKLCSVAQSLNILALPLFALAANSWVLVKSAYELCLR